MSKSTYAVNNINIVEGETEQREHFYKQIIQHLPGAFYICDAEGRITYYNKTAADLWGRKPEIGKDMWCGSWKIYCPDGQPLPLDSCPMAIALKEGRPVYDEEIIVERPDGLRRHIIPSPQPLFDSGGKLTGAYNILLDITETKRAQAEINEKNKSLEILNQIGKTISSELELDKVVQSVTDAATQISGAQFGAFFYNLLDEKGESFTLYALSGVSREAFSNFPMPRNTKVFSPTFHGTGIVRSNDITKDPRYGKNPPFFGMPEGHLPVTSYLAVPVVSRTGEAIGGLFFGHSKPGVFSEKSEQLIMAIASQAAIAMDNSKLYEASKKDKEKLAGTNSMLNSKNEELQKINVDLDNFIYAASHDLKAPISNIKGLIYTLTRILNKDNYSKEKVDSILQMMDLSVTRFSNTIDDLTTITKIQKNAEEELIEDVNLHELIEDIKLTYSNLFTETDADLNIKCETCTTIPFSRKNLKSILYNLMSNAIKYHSPDRKPVISISAGLRDEFVVLEVEDNGLGIKENQKEKIFEMFKRMHAHVEGSGVGLYIIKRIIENSGGKIEVESTEGQGSLFRVFLPGKSA